MNKFAKVPKCTLQWEGLGWYNNGYSHEQDYELKLKRKAKDLLYINGMTLNYDEAHELYTDLVSATLAVVVQKGIRSHLISISTAVRVSIPDPDNNDDIEVPESKVEEIIAWLRFVLGITPYTGDPETWEY